MILPHFLVKRWELLRLPGLEHIARMSNLVRLPARFLLLFELWFHGIFALRRTTRRCWRTPHSLAGRQNSLTLLSPPISGDWWVTRRNGILSRMAQCRRIPYPWPLRCSAHGWELFVGELDMARIAIEVIVMSIFRRRRRPLDSLRTYRLCVLVHHGSRYELINDPSRLLS